MAKTLSKDPVAICQRCGFAHVTWRGNQACTAHLTLRRTPTGGLLPCTLAPVTSLSVCHMHGASSAQSRAKATRAKQEAAAMKAATATLNTAGIYGIPRQIDPNQGLPEEYWRTAGVIAALERIVSGLEVDELVWGVVSRSTTARSLIPPDELAAQPRSDAGGSSVQGGDEGALATTEARTVARGGLNVWVQLFNAERDRFARLGVDIVKLGLEARRDEYIRAQVEVFASVLLAPELALTADQRRVAARLLRGLGAADTGIIEGTVT